jgi:hypothetical protein
MYLIVSPLDGHLTSLLSCIVWYKYYKISSDIMSAQVLSSIENLDIQNEEEAQDDDRTIKSMEQE